MPDRFAYQISTEKIRPLPGGEKYAAKVTRLVRNPGPTHEVIPINPKTDDDIGHEYWGNTEEEAYAKAKAEAEAWIEAQG